MINLWLLDDAYMSYSYAVSDISLEKIFKNYDKTNLDNLNRVDLGVFFNTAPNQHPTSCVLIEFKDAKTDISSYRCCIAQLQEYAKALKKEFQSLERIYAYYIADYSDSFKQNFLDDAYQEYSSVKGTVLWRYYLMNKYLGKKQFGLTINILNANNIVYDAEARHKTFMNILQRKYIEEEPKGSS